MNDRTNTESTADSEYLLLFRGNEWDSSLSPSDLQRTTDAFLAWFEQLSSKGILKRGQPLMDDARIVAGKDGNVVADGPFVESKEAIGGYFLITAESLDEATEIARQCPMLLHGTSIEVRPIAENCPTMQRVRQKLASHALAGAV